MKKLFALVLSLVMALSLCAPAYAAGETTVITSAEQLLALSATALTKNDSVAEEAIIELGANIDMKDAEFSAIIAQRGDTLTIKGNGYKISNVKFVSGVNDNTTGQASMFYTYPNSTLNVSNLTLENITVTADADGSGYAAAVVGYCEGAATLNNVDVVNATVTGVKSSGMLVGHLSGSLVAEDCDLSGTVTLADFAEETAGHYAGKYLGTMAGATTLTDCTANVTVSGNLNEKNIGDVYGRKTDAGSLSMTVDGVAFVANAAELAAAVANGATEIQLADGEYENITGCQGKTLTISGSKNAVLFLKNEGEDGCDYDFGSSGAGVGNITFNGVTIDTTKNTGNYKGYAYMKGTFNNCNFVGAYSLNNANDFEFNNCTFDFRNGYFWTWAAKSATFNGCTFNGNSKNILAHGWASTVITINNCAFAASEKGYASNGTVWTAAVEIDPAGTNVYTINFTGNNTINENYAGWTRIKDGSTGHTFEYTYSFNANGGTGTMTGGTAADGYELTLPANGFTAPSGKQFKGWATSADGDVVATATFSVTEPTTFYAIWEDVPAPTPVYPYYPPVVDDTTDKDVTSAQTFDAGIALYVGVSVMGAVGTAMLSKKRED